MTTSARMARTARGPRTFHHDRRPTPGPAESRGGRFLVLELAFYASLIALGLSQIPS